MKLIRRGTFETNSSSTHSLTICTKQEYQDWHDGKLLYYDEKLITKEEADIIIRKNIIKSKIETNWKEKIMTFKGKEISFSDYNDRDKKINNLFTTKNLNEITQEEIDEYIEDNEYDLPMNKEMFEEKNEELEYYNQNYTTKNGEELVAFGVYGFDG